jgi:hypothetical protein
MVMERWCPTQQMLGVFLRVIFMQTEKSKLSLRCITLIIGSRLSFHCLRKYGSEKRFLMSAKTSVNVNGFLSGIGPMIGPINLRLYAVAKAPESRSMLAKASVATVLAGIATGLVAFAPVTIPAAVVCGSATMGSYFWVSRKVDIWVRDVVAVAASEVLHCN